MNGLAYSLLSYFGTMALVGYIT